MDEDSSLARRVSVEHRNNNWDFPYGTEAGMPREILSQVEVESLLSGSGPQVGGVESPRSESHGAALEAASDAAKTRLREKISSYDFKRPARLTTEQWKAIRDRHEGLARSFAPALSALVRTGATVTLAGIEEILYGEFLREPSTCVSVSRAEPLCGNLVLDIGPSILYPIIDRLLGGRHRLDAPTRRPLTEIELRLASRVSRLFLEEWRRAWEPVLALELDIVRVESRAHSTVMMPPAEPLVLIRFSISLDGAQGTLSLCLPHEMVEQLAPKSPPPAVTVPEAADEDHLRQWTHSLSRAAVEAVVTLADSRITTQQLLALEVGDLITTEHGLDRPLLVRIGGVPRFHAKAGTLKGRKAFQVTEPIDSYQPEA